MKSGAKTWSSRKNVTLKKKLKKKLGLRIIRQRSDIFLQKFKSEVKVLPSYTVTTKIMIIVLYFSIKLR